MTKPESRIVTMRLQKFLARAGAASRRGSENLMTAGRVKVNGVVITELGSKVDPLVDVVEVDGVVVKLSDGAITLMLNKPSGVITTMKRQSSKPIVADYVPLDRYPGLYPIGRLDSDTTGLLLFSTDGELGNGLLHPRHHVEKTYCAVIEGALNDAERNLLEKGIELEDGMTLPTQVEILEGERGQAEVSRILKLRGKSKSFLRKRSVSAVRITLKEGRYHQVKRMFEAVGHPVAALHRESLGKIQLGSLEVGSWRLLTEDEVESLQSSIDHA